MKAQELRQALEAMATLAGVDGCALVEIDAGMVWGHAGQLENTPHLAEAASDYWRLYQRLERQFDDLGELRASVMVHAQGRITLLPCGPGMVLMALTRQNPELDWKSWQQKVRELADLVAQL